MGRLIFFPVWDLVGGRSGFRRVGVDRGAGGGGCLLRGAAAGLATVVIGLYGGLSGCATTTSDSARRGLRRATLRGMSAIAERRGTTAAAGELGFSESRLERTDALFEAFVEHGVIAGAVSLVARRGRIAQLAAYGYADRESATLMRPDTMFRLASMSKPVISVAILMLLEEGKIFLKEPISDFIPSFKDQTVQVQRGDEFSTERAQREVTLRDLLTHTAASAAPRSARPRSRWRRSSPAAPRRRRLARRCRAWRACR